MITGGFPFTSSGELGSTQSVTTSRVAAGAVPVPT